MKDVGLIMKEMQKHMNLIRGRFLEVFDKKPTIFQENMDGRFRSLKFNASLKEMIESMETGDERLVP